MTTLKPSNKIGQYYRFRTIFTVEKLGDGYVWELRQRTGTLICRSKFWTKRSDCIRAALNLQKYVESAEFQI